MTAKSLHLQTASCPTWMYWNTEKNSCKCGAVYAESVVLCSDHREHMQVAVLHGYCITHAKLDNQTFIVGGCQYNFLAYHSKTNSFYTDLPLDPSLVDSAMCSKYNRKGQLCGDCMEGYSVPIYTYQPQCVNCTEYTNNWGMYTALSLLPQTVFFVGVLVLKFRGTAPHMHGFILYSQLITPP